MQDDERLSMRIVMVLAMCCGGWFVGANLAFSSRAVREEFATPTAAATRDAIRDGDTHRLAMEVEELRERVEKLERRTPAPQFGGTLVPDPWPNLPKRVGDLEAAVRAISEDPGDGSTASLLCAKLEQKIDDLEGRCLLVPATDDELENSVVLVGLFEGRRVAFRAHFGDYTMWWLHMKEVTHEK